MNEFAPLLPMVVIVLGIWLLLIRPNQRRMRRTAEMQAALAPGDRVMLASGIFGTVVSLADERARVTVAPGVEVDVVRAAIAGKDEAGDQASGPAAPAPHDDAAVPDAGDGTTARDTDGTPARDTDGTPARDTNGAPAPDATGPMADDGPATTTSSESS